MVIQGVTIDNPTRTWTELQNSRHNVLSRRSKWNPSGWMEGANSVYTMCLANAMQFVAYGTKGKASIHNREPKDMTDAERLIMKAIEHKQGHKVQDIPEFNDASGRTFAQVLAVIDLAIEWVKPHAQTYMITIADEVMTPEEKAQMRDEVWAAEDAIWAEWQLGHKVKLDKVGRLRHAVTGRFVSKPTRLSIPIKTIAERVTGDFHDWLEDHERRGWQTFWDELECPPEDKPCHERKMRMLGQPIGAPEAPAPPRTQVPTRV